MDNVDIVKLDIDRLAALMAQSLPDLQCPDCCGPVHEFIECGAAFYREEWEWSCFVMVVTRVHAEKKRR
ncbi:MAG: hypothetical protein V4632_08575 [Pseudomonadota bacterium]